MLAHVLAFAGAALLLAMAPGPATAVLLRQTIRHGRRRGLATVAGIEAGVLFWAVTAAVGLTAVLAASEVAYTAIRIVGAVVLVGLGIQAFVRSRHDEPDEVAAVDARGPEAAAVVGASDKTAPGDSEPARRGQWQAFRAGMLTNVANPKAGVFAVSFLPQFIPRHSPVLLTGLLLAVVWVACDGTWYLTLTAVVHAARRWFARGSLRRRLERLSGVALIGFGLRLALATR